jgi:predicted enzyme related to lactoylglutathione lyase
MTNHEKINYIELPASDFDAIKTFYSTVFDWSFTDYGSEYIGFDGAGMDGGVYKSSLNVDSEKGSALIIFYSESLEITEDKIIKSGGKISKSIFSFPGGRRFHFKDPNNNEFAVWSTEKTVNNFHAEPN